MPERYCLVCEKPQEGSFMLINGRQHFVCKYGHKTRIQGEVDES